MSFLRATLALLLLSAFSGCGYVHFGRRPEVTAGDATLNTAYSNLSTDYKILKQELALARKQGDTLRTALETRSSGNDTSPEIIARLNDTTRELATLRTAYAKLGETKSLSSASAAQAGELEEKLAVSLRNYTRLQEENTRLRGEVDRTQAENVTLAAQVKAVSAQNEQTQTALAQLNTELLAQKDARARAEQQAAANAAQLTAVMARSTAKAATLADARGTSSTGAAAIETPLRLTDAPASDTVATAELRTNPARLAAAASSEAPRLHTVQPNETLERIAQRYYGDAARWRTIYFANNALLSGGRPLKPGMTLEIPKD